MPEKKKVLIFIVAYNAETTIESVIDRIVLDASQFDADICIFDDASADETFSVGIGKKHAGCPFPIKVFKNPLNQGYGGNQKLGYHYSIKNEYDLVIMLHGDGQYAPEKMNDLLEPLANGEADAVFGSRMLVPGGARKGGMPLYKYLGNKILSTFQNLTLGMSLSEFHSGYRAYSVPALKKIPFEFNSNDFHFDTEIIIQLLAGGFRIKEVPIPTYYGDEICYVNGIKYALDVVLSTIKYRFHKMGIFYQLNFDVENDSPSHVDKLDYISSDSMFLKLVSSNSKVLLLGVTENSALIQALKSKGCTTDLKLIQNEDNQQVWDQTYDYVLLVDCIETILNPEDFLLKIRKMTAPAKSKIIISAGNIAFFTQRLMLFAGQFNYGKDGILNKGHRHLFTFSTIKHLLKQSGLEIEEIKGIPAPYPKALGQNCLSSFLLKLNQGMIFLSKKLFAFQIFVVADPLPTVEELVEMTQKYSEELEENSQKIS